ncbi:hypothetical protein [Actinokineospora terrae]|uniref:Uncharacterized protein n=1 Tax=Actinokineospora terrae TaxID=155974 RepID=A0A1H9MUI3_9PSEU|nr:hypothetical protein [Actinokineospora terrae]SER27251.1 hypothetical protein SAMN04487818_102338 [Actinokineospora terrae]
MTDPPSTHFDGDSAYLANTLRHEPTDLLLNDSTGIDLVRHAQRQAWRLGVVAFAFCLVMAYVNSRAFDNAYHGDDASYWFVAGIVAMPLVAVLRWTVFARRTKKAEAISEWYTLLPDRAEAAESVYSHIAGRLRDRQLPVQDYVAKRVPTRYNTTGNRLVLVDGNHVVYVSVFRYGTSLYLGWSMWRIRSGADLYQMSQNETRADYRDYMGRILNLDRLKAMREAVHAVCREALHTAVRDVKVAEGYGFPAGMPPIEGLPYGSAPAVAPPPT